MNDETITIDVKDSILNSVKKQLGLFPEQKEFDPEIIMNINSAILTLKQIGVGPQFEPFVVEDDTQTYTDYLGVDSQEIAYVKMYLFYKTKMSFDPPMSSIVAEAMKAQISELEWRLNVQVDPYTTFQQGGEIS